MSFFQPLCYATLASWACLLVYAFAMNQDGYALLLRGMHILKDEFLLPFDALLFIPRLLIAPFVDSRPFRFTQRIRRSFDLMQESSKDPIGGIRLFGAYAPTFSALLILLQLSELWLPQGQF